MRKAWFVYQMGAKHPVPAIIYDDLPDKKNFLSPTILQKHELPEYVFYMNTEWCYEPEYLRCDEVQLSFNELCELYPYTGDAYDKPVKIGIEERKDVLFKATDALLAELG